MFRTGGEAIRPGRPHSRPQYMSNTRILFGLGNPGERYQSTRHNVGFMVLDHLAGRRNVRWSHAAAEYACARIVLARMPLLLVKPLTFMNLSGDALRAVGAEEPVSAGKLLVVCDDFNLPLGSLRLRRSGSDGGHNGLSSLIQELGTEAFARLRIGIGPAPRDRDPADFVLEPFGEEEMTVMRKTVRNAVRCVETWLEAGIDLAMSRFNTRIEPTESD